MPSAEQPARPLLSLEDLIWLHTVAVGEFGGRAGIRDKGALEAAIMRPLSGFGGKALFATPFLRAAAIAEAVMQHHGFVDGNKRTDMYAMAAWLEREGYRIEAKRGELRDLGLSIATHDLDLKGIAMWLKQHAVRIK